MKVRIIKAPQCGQCKRIYAPTKEGRARATDCCVCFDCKKNIAQSPGPGQCCRVCQFAFDLSEQRRRIRDARRQLVNERTHYARLEARGPKT